MTQQAMKHLVEEGEKIYHTKILPTLKNREKGNYAAIEVRSGQYFIGHNPLEAIHMAETQFPHKQFHIVRIGYKAAAMMKKGIKRFENCWPY